jgi:aminoglycoside phosphotransferase (APT) family kinase protein
MVYTEILPAIGLPYVRYRGTLEDSDRAWLFVEDAGGRRCARTEQPVSLARWLACLHTGGSLLPLSGRLPSRSAAHYREHLDAAVRLIAENRENSWLRPEERSVLDALLAGLRAVARDWLELTSETAALPATVVHADLKPSNIRVQTSAGEASVLVFDWEHCGWGTPASDLGALGYHLGLCHYWSALAGRWDGLQTSDVLRAARLGRLFRVLAGVHWAAMHLSYEWRSDRTTMRRSDLRLRFYRGELETVLSLLCSPRMRGRSRTQMISRAAR